MSFTTPDSTNTGPSREKSILAGFVVSWIAAGTFLVAKQTTRVFSPLELGWFRITLSFVVILLALRLQSSSPEDMRIPRKDWHAIFWMGLLGVTANQMLFLAGIHLAPPIDGAMIYAFTPLTVMIIARFTLGETLTWGKVGGIGLAIVGVGIVLRERGLTLDSNAFRGDLLMLLAMFSWAGYTLIGKKLMARHGALKVNTWAFGVGALSMLPAAPWLLPDFQWSAPGWSGWLGLAYLSVITSVLSFTLWAYALKGLEATRVAVFSNLQPPFTAILAWIFLGEQPGLILIFGIVLVVSGVWLTQVRQRPR